jgi:PAS domain S-box-containing protein
MPTTNSAHNLPPDLFRHIVTQAPDAIICTDCQGTILIWNQSAETIFGYAADEVVGKNLDIIIPERFRHAHWVGFNKAVETGKMRRAGQVLTTRATHKNGGKLYVDFSFGLVKDSAGIVTAVLATGRDCTERHLASTAPKS